MTPNRNESRDVLFLDGPYDGEMLNVSRTHAAHLKVAHYTHPVTGKASFGNFVGPDAEPLSEVFLYDIHRLNMFGYILDVAIKSGERLTDAHGLRVVALLIRHYRHP